MGEFGLKYYKIRPTNDRGRDPATKNKFNIQIDKNAIVNNAVDGIIMQDNNKTFILESTRTIYSILIM